MLLYYPYSLMHKQTNDMATVSINSFTKNPPVTTKITSFIGWYILTNCFYPGFISWSQRNALLRIRLSKCFFANMILPFITSNCTQQSIWHSIFISVGLVVSATKMNKALKIDAAKTFQFCGKYSCKVTQKWCEESIFRNTTITI